MTKMALVVFFLLGALLDLAAVWFEKGSDPERALQSTSHFFLGIAVGIAVWAT